MTDTPDIRISKPSVQSLLLQPMANGQTLGTATGFVAIGQDQPMLVTNRHVVTGRHQHTGEALHSSLAVPDGLRIAHNIQGRLGTWRWVTETLYTADNAPRWLEHPALADKVDVVALPLTNLSRVELYPYELAGPQEPIDLGVTTALSIIGFPFGVTGGGGFGVWVRGTIATEPAIDFGGLPAFLIDSRTRQGQSGSPVIFYQLGGHVTYESGDQAIGSGEQLQFVGVYSGRINDQSDLGLVWRASAVAEILKDPAPTRAAERPE